ncbi:MAG: signal peptidase II [Pseudoxanthomonas sp.]|nr:signal peptidase II [Pseudoxanthomonas sp.]
MSNTVKLSLAASLAFLVFELVVRWGIRTGLEPGETVPLAGRLYLTNATNINSIKGLGLSSVTWLFMALAICIFFVGAFQFLVRVPQLHGNRFASLGCFASFLLVAVVVANLFEALWLGGVTDYLASVDLAAGRAHIINLGDIFLALAILAIVIAGLGTGASLLASTTTSSS